MGANMPGDDAAQRDYWAMAGNRYRTFVREANDAIEQRDADLTALHVCWLNLMTRSDHSADTLS
jgi:hypothetical protein